MAKHDHHSCAHDQVAYCAHCDLTYCKGCNREWGKERVQYVPQPMPYPVYPKQIPWYPGTTWGGIVTSGGTSAVPLMNQTQRTVNDGSGHMMLLTTNHANHG